MKTFARKASAIVLSCALALGTLAGCSQSSDSNAKEGGAQQAEQATDRTVTDLAGNEVAIPVEAHTVATFNSVATQMVLMVGGEDAAASLGQGFDYSEGSLNRAMFPGLGSLSTLTRDDATVENMAALAPGFAFIDNADKASALNDAGIPALVAQVTSPETIMGAVRIIGEGLGGTAQEKASKYQAYYENAISEVEKASSQVKDADKPRVLYLRSTEKTTGAGSMPDSWITSAGGVNVAAELGITGSGADINAEVILREDPDIIVCENEKTANALKTDAAYADLSAVKNGKVYQAPFGTSVWSMGTAEAALQLYWAGSVINPDAFSGFDVDTITRDFFKTFYGYELSQTQIDTIFHR